MRYYGDGDFLDIPALLLIAFAGLTLPAGVRTAYSKQDRDSKWLSGSVALGFGTLGICAILGWVNPWLYSESTYNIGDNPIGVAICAAVAILIGLAIFSSGTESPWFYEDENAAVRMVGMIVAGGGAVILAVSLLTG